MSLGENIKCHRQRCGLSQEKLAELVGVSRQAVTKWESDLSSPSCENLLRLAEIFGTGAELLLPSQGESGSSVVEQAYQLYQVIEERKASERRRRIRSRAGCVLLLLAGFIFIHLIWCIFLHQPHSTMMGFLSSPFHGENSYLFGWLYSRGLYLPCILIIVLPAVFGMRLFSFTAFGGYQIGILWGVLLGPNPSGAFTGHTHYGWAIWGGIFLFSLAMGIVLERMQKRELSRRAYYLWAIGYAAGTALITLFVILSKVG